MSHSESHITNTGGTPYTYFGGDLNRHDSGSWIGGPTTNVDRDYHVTPDIWTHRDRKDREGVRTTTKL